MVGNLASHGKQALERFWGSHLGTLKLQKILQTNQLPTPQVTMLSDACQPVSGVLNCFGRALRMSYHGRNIQKARYSSRSWSKPSFFLRLNPYAEIPIAFTICRPTEQQQPTSSSSVQESNNRSRNGYQPRCQVRHWRHCSD